MTDVTPTEMLTMIGTVLHGERWRLALARDLGVDDDTIRRWMSGRTVLRPDHEVFRAAADLLRQRRGEIADAEAKLESWLTRATRP